MKRDGSLYSIQFGVGEIAGFDIEIVPLLGRNDDSLAVFPHLLNCQSDSLCSFEHS